MRILFATESYYPNIDGGAVAQHRLVHELVNNGHEVGVIAPNMQFQNTDVEDQGSTIFRTRAVKLPSYMAGKYYTSVLPLFHISKIIREFKPDIINVCSPYPNGVCAMVCAKKYGIPLVGSIHMLPENMLSPFLGKKHYDTFQKWSWQYLVGFYNRVDWATVPTQTGADMYVQRGLTTPITPISNGVNTTMFKPTNKGDYLRGRFNLPEKHIVLYTGRMSSEKNVDVLIKAIPDVIKTLDVHFLLCGSGGNYKQKMKDLVQTLQLESYVTFIDFLPWEDYPNIYTIADVFVMPAESELQSIVTLEAIASKLPVIVVNRGAVQELARHDNGLLFEPQDSTQLAAHIKTIFSDT
ncbi:MAG: glycosyltransferase, partial [Candidatus Thermoplasmatota archaeon]|nr:glycosyltransferase [Candidatus Thermoplasmatota archaeon]